MSERSIGVIAARLVNAEAERTGRVKQFPTEEEMPSTAVAERQEQTPAVSETTAILSMIERMARDPTVDIARVERMFALRKEVETERARREFLVALAELQPSLPIVDRRGRITIREKNGDKVIQSTPYALWEDINEAITPKLAERGFSLSFEVGQAADGKLTVTGTLGHAGGHEKNTTVTLVHDSTGSKNAVQAVGSSISYGKRYAAGLLLNITTRGEDDDGKTADLPSVITDAQTANLRNMIDETGANLRQFCEFFGIPDLPSLPSHRYAEATKLLAQKRQKAAAK